MLNTQCKILAIESSGATCGVALVNNCNIISDYSVYSNNLQDKLLAEFVKRILNDASLTINEIDAVAVSAGPGSFTGLRIGASIAKGLCYEGKPKLIVVPTLSSLANAAIPHAKLTGATEIIASVPSHKDLLYYQRFSIDGIAISEIEFKTIDELKSIIKSDTFICGPITKFIEMENCPEELQVLSPKFIANFGLKLFAEGRFADVDDFVPIYIQEFNPKTK